MVAGTPTSGAAPAAPTITPVTPAAPAPGTPEYDATMAAKFANAQPQPEGRPEWLPEKFKDPAELARAYAELEKKLGQPPAPTEGQPAGQPTAPQSGPKDGLKLEEQQAQDAVAKAGFDYAALQQEFEEVGGLKPETFAKLEQAGIPKPMVEAFIEGQKALAAQFEQSIHASVGGTENFTKLQQWANTNLTPAEKAAINAAVDSGNVETVKLAYSGLKARFDASFGSSGEQVQGGPAAALDVYESHAQMTADIRDPRYSRDPAFRARVEAKIGRSDALFPVQRL